jgi:hypothetical protein
MSVNVNDLLDEASSSLGFSTVQPDIDPNHLPLIDKVVTETTRLYFRENYHELMHHLFQKCPQTLSNCKFNDETFDCCKDVVTAAFEGFISYGVPIAKYADEKSRTLEKPVRFEVDAQVDWHHVPWIRNDDAFDGFVVIISQPYFNFAYKPIAVPPGWHLTIRLSQIKLRQDAINCVHESNLPKLRFLPYYDQDGEFCQIDRVTAAVHDVLALCNMDTSSVILNATSLCSFKQLRLIMSLARAQSLTESEVAVGSFHSF